MLILWCASVDNVVVKVEPGDLIPRRAGKVKAAFPWREGGANIHQTRPLPARHHLPNKKADEESAAQHGKKGVKEGGRKLR